jgi:hypothetical protein
VTEAESIKVIGIVAACFMGRFTKQSIAIWAKQMLPYAYEDGIGGANDHGAHAEHPSMKALIECIESARKRRCDREAQAAAKALLPAQAAGLDADRHERTAAAARAARELVENVARRRAMPAPDKTPAPVNARNGHEVQTPREAEERIRLLREQGERLLRESEAEAAK